MYTEHGRNPWIYQVHALIGSELTHQSYNV